MKKTLKQANGNWVEGEKFWGRETEVNLLITKIKDGANLLLIAQRRMGKTSLMHEVARRLNKEGHFTCLLLDLQSATSAEDAVVKLSLSIKPHDNLWNKAKVVFGNVLGGIEKINLGELGVHLRAGLTSGDWDVKGDQLFEILAASEKPVLLLLDEVPILVNRLLKGDDFTITPERRKKADAFLSWLRANCQKDRKGRVQIIISGSIGLEPILRQGQLSATINHLTPFDLKPWDTETAIECLKALAREYKIKLGDGAPEEAVKLLGCCIPHHVQMYFTRIQETQARQKLKQVSIENVKQIYHDGMLSVAGHAELTHYEERLKLVLGQRDFTVALEFLTEAAVSKMLTPVALEQLRKCDEARLQSQGITQDPVEAQKHILWVLEHDGYLRKDPQGYCFVSLLLRDWWEARHGGAFYTPIADRPKTTQSHS